MSEEDPTEPLVLDNRHTGEHLELRRLTRDGQVWLELKGTLPPHSEGPPLHVHYREAEEGRVVSGTLSAALNGRQMEIPAGGSARFPVGSVHRWWNDADETLVFEGHAGPVVDLDRYLEAVFEVANAGPPERPPLFYMAHVLWRHRRTQAVAIAPRVIQALVLPLIVFLGMVTGRYRGSDWPGCPDHCVDAPLVAGKGG